MDVIFKQTLFELNTNINTGTEISVIIVSFLIMQTLNLRNISNLFLSGAAIGCSGSLPFQGEKQEEKERNQMKEEKKKICPYYYLLILKRNHAIRGVLASLVCHMLTQASYFLVVPVTCQILDLSLILLLYFISSIISCLIYRFRQVYVMNIKSYIQRISLKYNKT